MNLQLVTDIELYINRSDAPDFCDSFVMSANYDGVPMTEQQLEVLNSDLQFMYEQVLKRVY